MAKQEDEEELADVLFLLVAVQGLVAFKLGPDVCQLLVNPLDLRLLTLAIPDVGDKDGKAAHPVASDGGHLGAHTVRLDGLQHTPYLICQKKNMNNRVLNKCQHFIAFCTQMKMS